LPLRATSSQTWRHTISGGERDLFLARTRRHKRPTPESSRKADDISILISLQLRSRHHSLDPQAPEERVRRFCKRRMDSAMDLNLHSSPITLLSRASPALLLANSSLDGLRVYRGRRSEPRRHSPLSMDLPTLAWTLTNSSLLHAGQAPFTAQQPATYTSAMSARYPTGSHLVIDAKS
jgi:hypothetical protein